jgi:fused signal recognition particle receptor
MAELFAKWRSGLAKTSKTTFGRLATLFGATEITQETWDELEALLIQADLGSKQQATFWILSNARADRGLTRS